MQQPGPAKETPEPDGLREQYDLLVESQGYLRLVVTAVLLSYYAVDQQRQQLAAAIESGGVPDGQDLFPAQLTSAMMVFRAVQFFYQVSIQAAESLPDDPAAQVSGELNVLMNGLILLVAVIRVYALLLVEFSEPPGESAELLDEEDPLI